MKVLTALPLILSLSPALAQSVPDGVVTMTLVPGWRDGATHYAGIAVDLAPGWHTYWRVSGEAGIPPMFDFGGSTNLESVSIAWPAPELFEQNGMTSIGYTGQLVLPLVLATTESGAPLHLEARIEIGVCKDVCIPFSADLWGDLAVPGAPDTALRAALDDGAIPGARAGVGKVTCSAEPIVDGLRITSRIALAPLGGREHVTFELPGNAVWVSDAAVSRDGGTLVAIAEMVPPEAKPFALDRSQLRLTVLAGGRAIDIQGCTGG